MASERELVRAVQSIATGVISSMKLTDVFVGTVTSAEPLKVQIDQKLILTKEQLVLTRNVTDYTSKINIDWVSDSTDHTHSFSGTGTVGSNSHTHTLKGEHTVKYLNSLKNGEKVVLVRYKNGQKYVIIDRVVV